MVDYAWMWSELLVRWLHVIAGIAWIGSSFYFIALDLSLKPGKALPEQAHGQAWQVHGGGFYNMVDMGAPEVRARRKRSARQRVWHWHGCIGLLLAAACAGRPGLNAQGWLPGRHSGAAAGARSTTNLKK